MGSFYPKKESKGSPKVSVIIPLFNCSRFFKQCIESVLEQTAVDIEIVVIDDCSTDSDYGKFLELYKDSRVKFIKNSTRIGAGPSRNKGIKLSSGDYIAFLDGDDYYPNPNSLSLLYAKAKADNLDICGGSLYIVDERSAIIDAKVPGQFFQKSTILKYSDYQHDGGFYRFIYKKHFLLSNKLFFPNLRRMQDPVFFVKAMIKAKSFFAFKDYVYAYRKGHKTIIWNENTILDHYSAIRIITNLSKDCKLSHLHYLMVKNFYHFSIRNLHKISSIKLQISLVLAAVRSVNFHLLTERRADEVERFNPAKLLSVILLTHIYTRG